MCCEDHLHCCPHGTICNLAASTCDDPTGGAVVPWLNKAPSFPFSPHNSKCDESSSCPGESTCCKTTSGAWACCPLPQVGGSEILSDGAGSVAHCGPVCVLVTVRLFAVTTTPTAVLTAPSATWRLKPVTPWLPRLCPGSLKSRL